MKAIVIGASGLVGGELYKQLVAENHKVVGTYNSRPVDGMVHLDIRNIYDVYALIIKESPDVVFLAAYQSWVDWCEENPRESEEVNVDGCINVADAVDSIDATLVFFSSSYVFSGKYSFNYVDSDQEPMNIYGRQKSRVEEYIEGTNYKYKIIRTVGVFGDEEKNFFGQVRDKLSKGESVFASSAQYMNPIYVVDLVAKTLQVVMSGSYEYGIYHIAGDTLLSKLSFARSIARGLGYSLSLIKEAHEVNSAPRPVYGQLYCDPLDVFPANYVRGLRRLING